MRKIDWPGLGLYFAIAFLTLGPFCYVMGDVLGSIAAVVAGYFGERWLYQFRTDKKDA